MINRCLIFVFARQEEKKKFEKQTAKFVQSQERHLNLSTKKQDSVLQEVGYSFSLLTSSSFASIITCSLARA